MNRFNSKYVASIYASGFATLLFVMSFSTIAAETDSDNAEIPVVSDLATALTLQGVDCDEIDAYKQLDENSYEVNCESGRSFSILGTADGLISIVDNLTGAVWSGVGTLISKIPLTGHIFKKSETMSNHEAEVALSLFSIIELSGKDCEAVEKVEKIKTDEHIVTCVNQMTYRVYNQENGFVMVDSIENSAKEN